MVKSDSNRQVMSSVGKPPGPGPFFSATAPSPDPEPQFDGARMRTVPRQQRARAAVNRILRATGELLDESGFDALTTTAVAERAEVNIATLYRYFPDKYALIEALAVSIETERYEKTGPMLAALPTSSDWRRDLRQMFEKLLDLRLKRTGVKGLRRALHSAPQLWATERAGIQRMVERLSTALRSRVPSLSVARAETIARTTLAMLVGLLDWGTAEPDQRRVVVREGCLAIERYLAPYLD
jgi:AcrR family transcriptional regulator